MENNKLNKDSVMTRGGNKIINFDMEGWPLSKASISDIIELLGGKLNKETDTWEIPNDPRFDTVYPRTLEDDGMGYGVNEMYVVDVDPNLNEGCCNIWVERQLNNAQSFLELNTYPGEYWHLNDKTWAIADILGEGDKQVVVMYEVKYNEDARCNLPDPKNGKAEFLFTYIIEQIKAGKAYPESDRD